MKYFSTALVFSLLCSSALSAPLYAQTPPEQAPVQAEAPAQSPMQATSPFTLALEAAYNNNPRLKAEREKLQALDESVNQAVSGFRPTIVGDASRGRQRSSYDNSAWNQSNSKMHQLTVEQPLFNGFGTWAQVKSAKNTVRAGRALLMAAEQDVLLAAVTSYMDVLQNESVLDLSKNNVEVLRQQLKAAQDRFDVGEVTRTDVAQSEARVARAISDMTQAEGALVSSRAEFSRSVGYEPGALVAPPLDRTRLPATLQEAVTAGLSNNPTLVSARFQERSADYDINNRFAALLPSLSLQGVARREEGAGALGNNQFDTDEVKLALRVPLYQSGAEYSRVREARDNYQRRRFDTLDINNGVVSAVTRAWQNLETARATIISTQEGIKAAEIALEGVKQEQQYGARTTLDVLDAEQELFAVRANLIRSQRNEVVALYTLLSTMGQLTAKDLALNVTLYDAKDHYDDVKYDFFGFR